MRNLHAVVFRYRLCSAPDELAPTTGEGKDQSIEWYSWKGDPAKWGLNDLDAAEPGCARDRTEHAQVAGASAELDRLDRSRR